MPNVVFGNDFKGFKIHVSYNIEDTSISTSKFDDGVSREWILPTCITLAAVIITVFLIVSIAWVGTKFFCLLNHNALYF